ncbi:type IX secretion system protein PorG [Mesonia maritima]|uniref:DUF6089 domain-containing protein n=1 Tax=Mesonia maritima TaxID=1793873 RepID=A0ABU1K3K6_9FLAO|nr:DUF6089 family protein [Mesonia maritima]MDR6300202.1 hypothetical protein [Mesonia maritima]
MRYLTVVIIMLLYSSQLQSQTYEVGPYVGAANFIGDVGATNYINPNTLAFGGVFKWNRSERHSFRLSIIHADLEADDLDSDETRRQLRGYSFKNSVTEASLGIEYTFWEWNLHNFKPQVTPYLYTGLTGIKYDDFYLNAREELTRNDSKINMAIPMVIGIKGTLDTHWVLALEIGARYTFTDNIDGSNPEEFDGGQNLPSFGNPNTNDWYMFTGITLTYTFGRKPCYCNF